MRDEGYSSCPVCVCVMCPFSLFCLLVLLGIQREVSSNSTCIPHVYISNVQCEQHCKNKFDYFYCYFLSLLPGRSPPGGHSGAPAAQTICLLMTNTFLNVTSAWTSSQRSTATCHCCTPSSESTLFSSRPDSPAILKSATNMSSTDAARLSVSLCQICGTGTKARSRRTALSLVVQPSVNFTHSLLTTATLFL